MTHGQVIPSIGRPYSLTPGMAQHQLGQANVMDADMSQTPHTPVATAQQWTLFPAMNHDIANLLLVCYGEQLLESIQHWFNMYGLPLSNSI